MDHQVKVLNAAAPDGAATAAAAAAAVKDPIHKVLRTCGVTILASRMTFINVEGLNSVRGGKSGGCTYLFINNMWLNLPHLSVGLMTNIYLQSFNIVFQLSVHTILTRVKCKQFFSNIVLRGGTCYGGYDYGGFLLFIVH